MRVGDLIKPKQENLSHLVGIYLGDYCALPEHPRDIQINVLWSDGMKTVELRDYFFVVSTKSS